MEVVPRQRRFILFMLLLFILLNFQDKGILGLAAIPIMEELKLTETQFGTIASSFYLLFSVSAILVGFVANRVGSKWLLAALVLVWSFAQLPVLIPAVGFIGLIVTRVMLGAGEGPVVATANNTAFTWYKPAERAFPSSMLTIGGAIGVIVGAPIMQFVIAAWGWRAAFGVLGAVGLIWMAVWLWKGKDGPYSNAAVKEAATAATAAGETPAAVDAPVPYRRLFAAPTMIAALVGGFAYYWGLALALAWLAAFLEQEGGFSRTAIGFLVGLPSAIAIVVVLALGVLTQRLVKRGTSRRLAYGLAGAGTLAASGVALFLLTRTDSQFMLVIWMGVAWSASAAVLPMAAPALGDITPALQRGAILGIWAGLINVASVISPYVTGRLIDGAATPGAGYASAFDLAGGIQVVAAVIFVALLRVERDQARLRPGSIDPGPATPEVAGMR
ncbi:MAG: MFS transporter [Streptosporangiales bacterium]|nr:MFS transporter [Streptosporangiales bacterium]